jgi:heptosyltransferase-3
LGTALVVRAGALGDVLLLRRAVAALRRTYRRVVLMAPGASGAVLVGPGESEVDELLPWESADVAGLFVSRGALRRAPLTPRSLRANESRFVRSRDSGVEPLRERLRGVELAVVYSRSADLTRGLGLIVPRVVCHDPAPSGGVHASQWLARPLEALGLEPPADLEPILPTPAEAAAARELLARLPEGFLAIHPGSGSPRKNWPAERFAAVLDSRARTRPWLLVEGPADAAAAAPLARRAGAVLARGLGVRALGAVLARAGLFIGHDSGVSHLAAAWGAPTLTLFGPTDPALWAPVGPRVRVLPAPRGQMEALSVDEVLSAVRSQV